MNYSANIDPQEVAKFSPLANQWWDLNGPCAPLHNLNPCRMQFIRLHSQLANKTVLDVGCGAGILAETLAKQGAKVTAIDASEELINAAVQHAQQQNLNLNYHATTLEDFILLHKQQFDIITCMELLEHVPDPAKLLQDCACLLKPSGKLFVSTLNRTAKAYALAIVGAEYIFNILEKQTHDYKKFIRPAELAGFCRSNNLALQDLAGMDYNPFTKSAKLSNNVNVNYLAYLVKNI